MPENENDRYSCILCGHIWTGKELDDIMRPEAKKHFQKMPPEPERPGGSVQIKKENLHARE